MSVENRPYGGTWRPNRTKLVQYTPDAMVYFNGSPTVRCCPSCNKRINLQEFITSMSVDAGTDAGSHSATVEMVIPRQYGDIWFRASVPPIRVALEVHIYMRGYFPIQGLNPNGMVAGISTAELPQYPYYHVFHGVVTNVTHNLSAGAYSVSLSCSSMLHFWNYVEASTNGSVLGARPTNSNVQTFVERGNTFSGMTPFAIMYDLYRGNQDAVSAIAFALQQRSNVDASVNGDELSVLATRYWERRFRTRMYGLRMYGVSGQMFTAAQQSFLARLSDGEIQRVFRDNLLSGAGRRTSDVLQNAALELGLLRQTSDGSLVSAADLQFLEQASERDSTGINVASLKSVVDDIQQYGSVNIFEATYESKMNIAQEVARVTGYEFYQDVDGDLVFKPPLYNLDTRGSRVYRVEPIDVISLSTSEAEPEATYMIVKNSAFRNQNGLGMEGEFGVRGQYVDYRLVAQFGWRPADLDTNFYNSSSGAFYAAVNQLDVMNAKVMNTLTLTIPLRPELRPGYPIYVAMLDEYYYIDGISHSFTFGAQCSTTLNCSARRRKFNAPGRSDRDGIGSVDLTNTILSPKPLRTANLQGTGTVPVGFPNVVLALDPNAVNPLYLLEAIDEDDLSNPEVLRLLTRKALYLGLMAPMPDESGNVSAEEGPWRIPAGEYANVVIPSLQALARQPEPGKEVLVLLNLVKRRFSSSEDLPDPESETAILQLLSDRKGSFSNNSVPGEYRYYSSSHPDPEMQGMRELAMDPDGGTRVGNLYPMENNRDTPVTGFAPVESNIPPGVATRNFVETISNATVQAGINLSLPRGSSRVTPTHRILTLSFARHTATIKALRTSLTGEAWSFNVNLQRLTAAIMARIQSTYGLALEVGDPNVTVAEYLAPICEGIQALPLVFTASLPVEPLTTYRFPDASGEPTRVQDTRVTNTLQELSLARGMDLDATASYVVAQQAKSLATWMNSYYDNRITPFNTLRVAGSTAYGEFQAITASYRTDSTTLTGTFVGSAPSVTLYFQDTQRGQSVTTPVFPVSDASGYEVVGSYRFGRGMSIEPGANFSQLQNLDPLRFADTAAIDAFVEELSQRGRPTRDGGTPTEAETRLLQSLLEDPTAGPAVDILTDYAPEKAGDGTESTRTAMLAQGLRNYVATDRESVFKVPVSNAAFRLADLRPDDGDAASSCECGSPSDVGVALLGLASDPDRFLVVEGPGALVSQLQDQVELLAVPWAARQEALRGSHIKPNVPQARPNPTGNGGAATSLDVDASIGDSVRRTDDARARLGASRARLRSGGDQ